MALQTWVGIRTSSASLSGLFSWPYIPKQVWMFCFSRFLESTNYTHSQRTSATAGKTAECTRWVGNCPLLHDAFFHNWRWRWFVAYVSLELILPIDVYKVWRRLWLCEVYWPSPSSGNCCTLSHGIHWAFGISSRWSQIPFSFLPSFCASSVSIHLANNPIILDSQAFEYWAALPHWSGRWYDCNLNYSNES